MGGCFANQLDLLRCDSKGLGVSPVTGAKVRAEADFLLAATRGSSIQPVYEYPAKDIWSIACGIAAARGAAAGRRGRTQACRRRATRGDRPAERLEGASEH